MTPATNKSLLEKGVFSPEEIEKFTPAEQATVEEIRKTIHDIMMLFARGPRPKSPGFIVTTLANAMQHVLTAMMTSDILSQGKGPTHKSDETDAALKRAIEIAESSFNLIKQSLEEDYKNRDRCKEVYLTVAKPEGKA